MDATSCAESASKLLRVEVMTCREAVGGTWQRAAHDEQERRRTVEWPAAALQQEASSTLHHVRERQGQLLWKEPPHLVGQCSCVCDKHLNRLLLCLKGP